MNRQKYIKACKIYQTENLNWEDKWLRVHKLIKGVKCKQQKETTEEQYKEALEMWLNQTNQYLTRCEENERSAKDDLKQLRELILQNQKEKEIF